LHVKTLRLEHYRNIGLLELSFHPGVNLLIGANAQGKTNILESLLVLSLTKSHRTHNDKELIGWQAESAQLSAVVEKKYGETRLDLRIGPHGKTAKVNGLEQRKLSGFIGTLNVVMFAPEDLEIVKGSPAVRRRFMDMEIGQVHPSYLHHLQQYRKIVMQKNNEIKKGDGHSAASRMMVDVWNEQLAAHGVKIIKNRQNFINKLQVWAQEIHGSITGGGERIGIVYKPSFDCEDFQDETVVFNQFMIKLSQVKDQEYRRGSCLIGPHRDDLALLIDGKDAFAFGSQGQQRTAALSLKLAELELIREEVGEYPVLLLDDVLSELDRTRQSLLIDTFRGKVQTFITATGIESVGPDKIGEARLFNVREGSVTAV